MISPVLNDSKFICEKCVLTLRFVMLYNEYFYLRVFANQVTYTQNLSTLTDWFPHNTNNTIFNIIILIDCPLVVFLLHIHMMEADDEYVHFPNSMQLLCNKFHETIMIFCCNLCWGLDVNLREIAFKTAKHSTKPWRGQSLVNSCIKQIWQDKLICWIPYFLY